MSVSSLEYLFLLLLICSLFFRIPGAGARRLVFAACSASFLATYIPNYQSWIVLLAFLLSGYGCAQRLRARPSPILLTTYLVLLVAAFALVKKYAFLQVWLPEGALQLGVEIVGLSYMLFRQIQFLVDSMQGQVERPTLWGYLNYQLNPFTLLAGPIQRYQDFKGYWQAPVPLPGGRHEILKAYIRLFIGTLEVVLLSRVFQKGYLLFLNRLDPESGTPMGGGWKALAFLIVMLYCFMFYLYMNFAGYCDIVIAGASLVGLKLPENFNQPLLVRNILDYWLCWHITLGHWIRDYVFAPFYKAGAERLPAHTSAVAVAGYFVAFTLAGIWHGSTWNFVVYGLLQGAGASAAKLWENAIVRYAGRPGLRKYLKSPSIRLAAIVATFHYVCFTLLFFALDLDRGWRILARVLGPFTSAY